MKIICAARVARWDLMRAANQLARFFAKWDRECDRQLYRLVCYMHSTKHLRMVRWVADQPSDLSIHLYADADFAGCAASQRSTSGAHLVVRGPKSSFALSCLSKRQGCVSLSTPEAEIVATQIVVKAIGLPAIDLWHTFRGSGVIQVHEDNQAMIAVVRSGKNPTMRHIKRTHGESIAWLHELFQGANLSLCYEISTRMSPDIYTKRLHGSHYMADVV